MKTRYKYIHFEVGVLLENFKYEFWYCKNNYTGEQLGIIEFYVPWQQYCYIPNQNTVYSKSCMEDINNFIEQISKPKQRSIFDE